MLTLVCRFGGQRWSNDLALGILGGMISQGLLKFAGIFFFVLGGIGIVLPLLPTTIFWILAAICFTKAAPEWLGPLRGHATFGPGICDYLDHGVISNRGKWFAISGMSGGTSLGLWILQPSMAMGLSIASVVLFAAIWILRHPSEPQA